MTEQKTRWIQRLKVFNTPAQASAAIKIMSNFGFEIQQVETDGSQVMVLVRKRVFLKDIDIDPPEA